MLQFIVLGIVPGTSIQLSFTDILIGGMLMTGLPVAYWSLVSFTTRRKAMQIAAIRLISL